VRRNHLAALDDAALVASTREGDLDAFGVLWERHRDAVTRAARAFTGYDADDVTAEAFARVLRQVRAGGGPDSEPRAYLVRTARNVATEWARRDGGAVLTAIDEESAGATDDHADAVDRRAAARAAYERLPERWRQALWYREVEDLPVAECARILGATSNSTTVILRRAREGFAQEWIRENLERRGAGDECAWVTARLPRHARGKTTPGDARRITAHLAGCADCTLGEAEARYLDGRLAVLLLPALLGTDVLRRALGAEPGAAAAPTAGAVARLLPRSASGRWALAGTAAAVVGAIVVTALVWPRPVEERVPVPVDAAAPSPTPEPTPTVESTPDAETAPEASAAPVPPAPGASASPAPAPVGVVERGLTIDAVPASTPLYPMLTGLATSGATVEATFTGTGGSLTAVTTAGPDGRWSLTQSSISGAVTFAVTQRYTNAAGASVTETAGGSVSIVANLTLEVMSTGDTTSTILLTGPAGANVDLRSTSMPTLDGMRVLGADGKLSIPTAVEKGAQAPLRVRLVSGTATGPWVTW